MPLTEDEIDDEVTVSGEVAVDGKAEVDDSIESDDGAGVDVADGGEFEVNDTGIGVGVEVGNVFESTSPSSLVVQVRKLINIAKSIAYVV